MVLTDKTGRSQEMNVVEKPSKRQLEAVQSKIDPLYGPSNMDEIPTFDFEPIDRGFCGVCLTGSSKSQSESSLISMGTGLEGFLGGALM